MKVGEFMRAALLRLLEAATGKKTTKPKRSALNRDCTVVGPPKLIPVMNAGGPALRMHWRVVWNDRSKYMPHQGKQECARRIRQGLA